MSSVWDNNGVLPPIKPGVSGCSTERSPYQMGMSAVVETFSFSKERKIILKGLIEHRKALYDIGIIKGFQWIDGSFMEDVETLERRSPNDVDVVTFFHLPDGMSEQDLYNQYSPLFIKEAIKKRYKVDGYFIPLGEKIDSLHVRQIAYWYSMWSHKRNGLWKGFLEVELSPGDDELAAALLNEKVHYE